MTSQIRRNSTRRWLGATLDNFRHPDRLDRREWTSAINQWDIPALFGQDPMGITPMQVKLEKIGGRASNRLLGAHASAAIAALGLSLMGHHNVRLTSVRRYRMAPVCAYGVCLLPYDRNSTGVIVPVFAPRRIGSEEAAAAGWLPPDSSSDHTAMVPKWALAMAGFVAGVTDPEWVGLAAISPYFSVTRYVVRVDRDQSVRLVRRAAQWFHDHLRESGEGAHEDVEPMGDLPNLSIGDGSVPATGEVKMMLKELRDAENAIALKQAALDDMRQELIARLGRARRFVDPKSGAVLGEIASDPAVWTPCNPSPSGRELTALRNLAVETPGKVGFHVYATVDS